MSFTEKSIKAHQLRFERTLKFLEKHIPKETPIFDIGVSNPMAETMRNKGYIVYNNTEGVDLDFDLSEINSTDAQVFTAFEIFEHLLAPFNLLCEIKAKKLIATVPLRLWYSSAYRNKNDIRDRHFHEFEDWQFDWLLEKAGWTIIDREKWISPTKITGLRPLLRNFTPRHYAIYAERK